MSKPRLDDYRTPHKINRLVVAPSYRMGDFDSHAVDAPFLFLHEGRYFMTYIGWDRTGYRTGLASSTDLEHWRKEGLILDRGPGLGHAVQRRIQPAFCATMNYSGQPH